MSERYIKHSVEWVFHQDIQHLGGALSKKVRTRRFSLSSPCRISWWNIFISCLFRVWYLNDIRLWFHKHSYHCQIWGEEFILGSMHCFFNTVIICFYGTFLCTKPWTITVICVTLWSLNQLIGGKNELHICSVFV